MSSISDRSAAGSSNGYARKLSLAMKPTIGIHIDNHYRSKVYTSASTVSGHISINSHRDVRFDAVQILLLGNTRTRIDGVNIPQATSHTFLKLVMPIPESHYPVPRTLEAGRTYIIPFHFVVPRHLTINACNHKVSNDGVRDYHVRLPPTVGFWDRDDLAPEMSRIEYAIRARVLREDDAESQLVRLFEASQQIRVLPASPAEPPLSITPSDKLYNMSKTKTMRKTILSSKLGKVTVSANQPPAAMLSPDGRSAAPTTAHLDLCFEPAATAPSGGAPPRVTSVSSKIVAVSYYSTSGVRCLPNLGDWGRKFGYEGNGSYSNTTSLPSSSLTAPQVVWKQQSPAATQLRRDSGYGTEVPSDSDRSGEASEGSRRSSWSTTRNFTKTTVAATKGSSSSKDATTTTTTTSAACHYTASLQVPIQLPIEKKAFLPTFHSCITSRAYVLWLTVSLSCGGMSSSVTLSVPLQVGVESAEAPAVDPTGLPSFETAVREAEADEYLRPRVMSIPTIEFQHAAATELPGYAYLAAGAGRGVVGGNRRSVAVY